MTAGPPWADAAAACPNYCGGVVERATIFGSEANAYDELRPRYPAEAIDLLVADDPALLIDAGCGTGIAARQVADRGVNVLGVKPDPRMAAVAQAQGTEVTVVKLEDWEPVESDGLYAAQSWHWIDPNRGATVAATTIQQGGRWMACWNVDVPDEVRAACDEVYRRLAPALVRDRPDVHLKNHEFEDRISHGLEATACFEPIEKHSVSWLDRITPQRFDDRIDSHSANRLLADELRQRVREALIDALDTNTDLEIEYRTELLTARRL